jgi:hypothetical protein
MFSSTQLGKIRGRIVSITNTEDIFEIFIRVRGPISLHQFDNTRSKLGTICIVALLVTHKRVETRRDCLKQVDCEMKVWSSWSVITGRTWILEEIQNSPDEALDTEAIEGRKPPGSFPT